MRGYRGFEGWTEDLRLRLEDLSRDLPDRYLIQQSIENTVEFSTAPFSRIVGDLHRVEMLTLISPLFMNDSVTQRLFALFGTASGLQQPTVIVNRLVRAFEAPPLIRLGKGKPKTEVVGATLKVNVGEEAERRWRLIEKPTIKEGRLTVKVKVEDPSFKGRTAWLVLCAEEGQYPLAVAEIKDRELVFEVDLAELSEDVKASMLALKEDIDVGELFAIWVEA